MRRRLFMLPALFAIAATANAVEPVTESGKSDNPPAENIDREGASLIELPPPSTMFVHASFALGLTSAIDFSVAPKLELGYQVDHSLSFAVGASCIPIKTSSRGMGTITSALVGSTRNFEIGSGKQGNATVVSLPVTLDVRYLWITERIPVYFELGAGYAFTLVSGELSERFGEIDPYGNYIYADRKLNSRITSFFFSTGVGLSYTKVDVGLTFQTHPAARFGTDDVEVRMLDPYGDISTLGSISRKVKGAPSFIGFKVAYRIFFKRSQETDEQAPQLEL